MFGSDPLTTLVVALPGILIGLVFHEYAHARMAYAFGDPTPRLTGRLTLDPRSHLDPFGTLVLVISAMSGGGMFGWARPVTVNTSKFRNRFWGDVLVSSAGVMMNLLLAILFSVLATLAVYGLLFGLKNFTAGLVLGKAAQINLWLAVFNFLPVPPLDGWHVLRRVIPGFAGSSVAQFLDQFGMFVLMVLVFILPRALGTLLTPILVVFDGLVRFGTSLILKVLGLG